MNVEYRDYELVLHGPKGRERLKINGDYPKNPVSEMLFSNLGMMHLVAAYLPRRVKTNFELSRSLTGLIGAMYVSEGRKPPVFSADISDRKYSLDFPAKKRAVVAYSGGKDSMWNMWWAQREYGAINVAALHISGLNRNNAAHERTFCLRQEKEFGFKNFKIVGLLNSSRNTGYRTMLSRDIFLAGVAIPVALKFGARGVITEGFAETGSAEPFSGQSENIWRFNELLEYMEIPVRVNWRNRLEMDAVQDLFEHKPEWMPHVCNCFASPHHFPHRRAYWTAKAPSFKLYDSQCGSCVKCRIINLGRILYDPGFKANKKDVTWFLQNTDNWIKTNHVKLRDMIGGSFSRDFKTACANFGVSNGIS